MLPWVTILIVMMMMKRNTVSADITNVTRISGESLKLSPDIRRGRMGTELLFRWTHPHLLLDNRKTKCHHGRCELLEDGSLSFSRVQSEDSGVYRLEVYNQQGRRQHHQLFHLQVEHLKEEESSQSWKTAIVCSLLLLLILLLLIISFLLWKRKLLRSRTSGAAAGERETQIYMEMRGNHGDKDQEEGEKKEEEAIYVPCYPGVPAEPVENVYV
ncbi:uncharacterized protein LOC122844815 isoform X2 [Gambusia affinis]|uniref:uncharacterized protein LOC122844815 isoform X2 n=1 Tax=Gambusia affinis TaxID=33528 RepID=UPI001CDD67B0|nr:uncharacterized protein LOC122844815 isoform X2 [Gambusia affinis]